MFLGVNHRVAPLILIAAMSAAPALAVPITTADPGSLITQFGGTAAFTGGPVTLENGVVYTSNYSMSVVNYRSSYNFAGNGDWQNAGPNGIGFAGVNLGTAIVRLTLPNLASQVGGFLNYAPGFGTFTIRALDDLGNVLESLTISGNATYDILTPGGVDAGAYRGFDVGSALIRSFELEGSYGAITDFTFLAPAAGAPELNSTAATLPLAFLAIGLALVGSGRKRLAQG